MDNSLWGCAKIHWNVCSGIIPAASCQATITQASLKAVHLISKIINNWETRAEFKCSDQIFLPGSWAFFQQIYLRWQLQTAEQHLKSEHDVEDGKTKLL